MGGFFGFIVIIFFAAIIFGIVQNQKSKAFKQNIVAPIINDLFDDVYYDYSKGFDRSRIRDTKLVSNGSDFKSSDYIRGTHNGIAFEFSDVYVADTTVDSEGHSHTTVFFRGQWLVLKPHRKITGRLYVIDKQLAHSYPQGGLFIKDKSLERVYTESDVFNKEYRVFASHPQEAFYVLTPPKILEFMSIHKEDVSFYLNDQELHVAIYSRKALLEPKLFKSNDDPMYVDMIKSTMLNVMNYLDYFVKE
jgi:hypothetical protein